MKLNPKNHLYHYNYAYLCETHFDGYILAKKHYEKAISLAPEDPDAYINLAYLQLRCFGGDGALATIIATLECKPENPFSYKHLRRLAEIKPSQIPEIVNLLATLIKQNPQNKPALCQGIRQGIGRGATHVGSARRYAHDKR
ncbi:MAG: tetratricopeptide repeat protein [Sphingobacteriales bacterium]|nr:MAG: tetratricopeptide repeat protein [Sphingobacteriales bacterium]